MLIRSSLLGTYAVGIRTLQAFVLGAGLILAAARPVLAGEGPLSSAAQSVWGCLLYASNQRAAEKASNQIPTRIRGYDERLERLLGYASLQTLGQGETIVEPNALSSIVFHGNIRIELTGLTRQTGEDFLVGLRLFHGDHQLIETQAKVSRGSPLFIRGPLWRDGQLVVAVMVVSSAANATERQESPPNDREHHRTTGNTTERQ